MVIAPEYVRTKHPELRYQFIRDCIENGILAVQFVPGEEHAANISPLKLYHTRKIHIFSTRRSSNRMRRDQEEGGADVKKRLRSFVKYTSVTSLRRSKIPHKLFCTVIFKGVFLLRLVLDCLNLKKRHWECCNIDDVVRVATIWSG